MNAPYKIIFRGQSSLDFGCWTELAFDSDDGDSSSFLNQEAVASDSYNGSFRRVYGYKYNEVLSPQITFVKQNYSDFSEYENRKILSWLTGSKTATFLDVCRDKNDVVSYSILGNFTEVSQYKTTNGCVIGYICTFESVSPYAFSLPIVETMSTSGEFIINCNSDELDAFVYPKLTLQMNDGASGNVNIVNRTNGIITLVSNMISNEKIVIDGANRLVYSITRHNRIFGSDFNWTWQALNVGANNIIVDGECSIDFEWREPRKVGSL